MFDNVVVYRAEQSDFSLVASLHRLMQHREVLLAFGLRDLKVKYKQTLLGLLWAVIPPVMLMVVFNVVFSRFARMPSEGLPYPLFVYSALLPWTFFSSSITGGAISLTSNSSIISKINFPREILPWSAMLAPGVDFAVSAVVLFGLFAWYRTPLTLQAFWVVLLLITQILFAAGIGLIAAASNVYYRDVRYFLPLLMQLWLYATPVVYPTTVIPAQFRLAYFVVNPMAGFIDGYRRVLLRGVAPDLVATGLSAVSAVVVFVVCYRIFKRLEREFADVV